LARGLHGRRLGETDVRRRHADPRPLGRPGRKRRLFLSNRFLAGAGSTTPNRTQDALAFPYLRFKLGTCRQIVATAFSPFFLHDPAIRLRSLSGSRQPFPFPQVRSAVLHRDFALNPSPREVRSSG
jgi:hypothetical protein